MTNCDSEAVKAVLQSGNGAWPAACACLDSAALVHDGQRWKNDA